MGIPFEVSLATTHGQENNMAAVFADLCLSTLGAGLELGLGLVGCTLLCCLTSGTHFLVGIIKKVMSQL